MFLHTVTDACTPVCLLTAITSVEAVTPPRGESAVFNSSSRGREVNPANSLDAVERVETQATKDPATWSLLETMFALREPSQFAVAGRREGKASRLIATGDRPAAIRRAQSYFTNMRRVGNCICAVA